MRALGWGTLFAFMGTGAMAYGIWKLSGAKDVSCVQKCIFIEFIFKCISFN